MLCYWVEGQRLGRGKVYFFYNQIINNYIKSCLPNRIILYLLLFSHCFLNYLSLANLYFTNKCDRQMCMKTQVPPQHNYTENIWSKDQGYLHLIQNVLKHALCVEYCGFIICQLHHSSFNYNYFLEVTSKIYIRCIL